MTRVLLDGCSLSPEQLAQIAAGGVELGLTRQAWENVRLGREIVDRSVMDGADYYGVNTGVGSQKDSAVRPEDFTAFNDHVIVAEATNMPGPAFDEKVVRGALCVLVNNAATGRLGMRPELVERMLRLFHFGKLPEVRSGTSSGMADLGPLAQLALPLVGRSLRGGPCLIEGPYDLAGKEAVSLINCNAFALAHAALVLQKAQRLLGLFDLATAASLEALRGNLIYYGRELRTGYRNAQQIASCERIAEALEGSALWQPSEWRFLQDPLSFRFAMRVNGAVGTALDTARAVCADDLNCVCDNPVVSLETRRMVTGINMDSTPLTAAVDMLRQTIAMASAVSTERSLKTQNPTFSGLPQGLAKAGHADGGVQNLIVSYLSVARQAELRGLAAPVLLDCAHALADGIEDVSGLAPLSVQRTEQVMDLALQVVTAEIVIAVWAIAARGLHPRGLGKAIRQLHDLVRPHLPIGEEGRQVFDMASISEKLWRLDDDGTFSPDH